ncbi:hypothetical protein [Sulfurifustis variabilis]|uniref:hypothetical protein n=1 Tax=Sulfurifustis variabilis TaxID=1675686 RepID=UPI0011E4CBAC|nr:hypothetical protein [Sulfurifustis variabilis]
MAKYTAAQRDGQPAAGREPRAGSREPPEWPVDPRETGTTGLQRFNDMVRPGTRHDKRNRDDAEEPSAASGASELRRKRPVRRHSTGARGSRTRAMKAVLGT